jgi:hypothetical protein
VTAANNPYPRSDTRTICCSFWDSARIWSSSGFSDALSSVSQVSDPKGLEEDAPVGEVLRLQPDGSFDSREPRAHGRFEFLVRLLD